MLTVHHLHKSYGVQPILQDISFNISNRERIGLIGQNGCGKTTLLRILSKQERPDSGTVVSTRTGLRVGYLAQGMEFTPEETLQSALNPTHIMEADIVTEVGSIATALSADPNNTELQTQYDLSRASLHLWVSQIFHSIPPSSISPADKRRVSCWLASYARNRICFCWMNPPTISISKCSNGWKTG
jgi:ATPase subunit of ABC transporter with duplicated ATPase domains